jgi:hypothetical protein
MPITDLGGKNVLITVGEFAGQASTCLGPVDGGLRIISPDSSGCVRNLRDKEEFEMMINSKTRTWQELSFVFRGLALFHSRKLCATRTARTETSCRLDARWFAFIAARARPQKIHGSIFAEILDIQDTEGRRQSGCRPLAIRRSLTVMPSPIPADRDPNEHPLITAFRDKLSKKKCRFMVFGPNPSIAPATALRDSLLKKRLQIRDHIGKQLSCAADFPEELFKNAVTDIPILADNIVRLELESARIEFDLVIILLESPGTCVELGYFCADVDVKEKTAVFILDTHKAGLAANTATADARYCFFYAEADLDSCNLLTHVSDLVAKVQRVKFLAP